MRRPRFVAALAAVYCFFFSLAGRLGQAARCHQHFSRRRKIGLYV